MSGLEGAFISGILTLLSYQRSLAIATKPQTEMTARHAEVNEDDALPLACARNCLADRLRLCVGVVYNPSVAENRVKQGSSDEKQ